MSAEIYSRFAENEDPEELSAARLAELDREIAELGELMTALLAELQES